MELEVAIACLRKASMRCPLSCKSCCLPPASPLRTTHECKAKSISPLSIVLYPELTWASPQCAPKRSLHLGFGFPFVPLVCGIAPTVAPSNAHLASLCCLQLYSVAMRAKADSSNLSTCPAHLCCKTSKAISQQVLLFFSNAEVSITPFFPRKSSMFHQTPYRFSSFWPPCFCGCVEV